MGSVVIFERRPLAAGNEKKEVGGAPARACARKSRKLKSGKWKDDRWPSELASPKFAGPNSLGQTGWEAPLFHTTWQRSGSAAAAARKAEKERANERQ